MSIIEAFKDAWNATIDRYALRGKKPIKPGPGQHGFNWDEDAHPRNPKNTEGGHGGEFRPKMEGIVLPTKANAEAKAGDQLGLFGEASKPKTEGAATVSLKPGEETKGRAQNLFDTHGPANQMDLFGDGVMPDELVNPDVKKPKDEPLPDGPIPFRDRRAFADKMAASGKTHQEIVDAMQSRGVAAVDARRHAAMAMGDLAQSKSADQAPKAETVVTETESAQTPPEKASVVFDNAIDANKTPREAAEAAQKKLDADYEFARASTVKNAGEDLKGSARHRVNAWKSLAEAEKDGTAAEMITRESLLKNEPHTLMVHADKNPLTALAMHYAMRAFPANPGTKAKGDHKKDREQFLEAYRSVKDKAEQLAQNKDSSKAADAIAELQKHVGGLIDKFRGVPPGGSSYMGTDKYNQTANDLVSLHKALQSGWRANKTGVAGRLNEFAAVTKDRYGDFTTDTWDNIAEHAKDIIEGHSLNKTFDKKGKELRRFDPAEAYVKVAKRMGGRDLSKVVSDPNKATEHMVKEMGLRGVQWGNTVSDEERKHHAGKALEALVDLADVTGLHPKDIALDGKLGLAIGARGKGNASAHYEPGNQVINLTRSSGVGALAHEWGHAFDHSLNNYEMKTGATRSGKSRTSGNYLSTDLDSHDITLPPEKQIAGRPQWKSTTDKPERMKEMGYIVTPRPLSDVRVAYQKWAEASKPFRERLKSKLQDDVKAGFMSTAKANEYWNSDHEIFARSFERHVQHKLEADGRENTYLAGFGGTHPYWPNDEETKAMADAFDGIMAEYRKHKHGSAEKVRFSQREAREAFKAVFLGRESHV